MTRWTVPLAEFVMEEGDLDAVVDTYRSGWVTLGPRTARFERAFADFVGCEHAIAVSSCTAALHLMCLAHDLGPGDEVIVPSMTFVATANAVRYTGATPVFADIASLDRPWLSASTCEAALTARTRAVLYVSYGGHAGELAAVRELCRERGIVLLEDAAHAAGARFEGRHLGTFGAAGAFSLFSNKNLAVGEGGVVTTDDDTVKQRVELLRSHGMTSVTWDRHRGHASTYDVVELGFNYRIDEPRAALATRRLERLDRENAARGRLVERYRRAFEGAPATVALPPAAGVASAHHLFVLVLDEDLDRDRFREHLARHGVQTSLHYPPIHRMSIYDGPERHLPLTERYARRAVTLPLFAHMTDEQQDTVVTCAHEGFAFAHG